MSDTQKNEDDGSHRDRQAMMAVLAAADKPCLLALWQGWPNRPEHKRVRGPETGLVMVRGRTGGGGAPFNLGEATVTRATVRIDTGQIGHAYALGRDDEKVLIAALFDAIWQRPEDRQAVEDQVIAPLRAERDAADKKKLDETAATKVDFFTLVRGDD